MDMSSQLEEELRESCCIGNTERIHKLINQGVNVNSQNKINGWTSLHWAAKRGHDSIIRLLLDNKAEASLQNFKGETPADVALNKDTFKLLQGELNNGNIGESNSSRKGEKLNTLNEPEINFIPNYLANPIFPHAQSNQVSSEKKEYPVENSYKKPINQTRCLKSNEYDELVLKVRLVNCSDFIEVEMDFDELSFESLLSVCCKELNLERKKVFKVRKLPNTLIRKDKEVKRFKQFQEIEIEMVPEL